MTPIYECSTLVNFKSETISGLNSPMLEKTSLPESTITFLIRVFNWYFVIATYLAQILQAFFSIYFLGYDLLFTLLTSLIWLAPTTFNFAFLVSSATFKTTVVTSHMRILWTLLTFQGLLTVVSWQLV